MNLLLLLSALLSALTGVGTRVGGPEPVQAVARENAQVAVAAEVAKRLSVRPVSALPQLAEVAFVTPVAAFTVATVPAWATRRRE
ncbi:hypothetical protein M0208_03155 [Sphingomonas sp. SUN019]|uniref:hypothetical protein n=1 Tax=Sphingomonas sp. SUN019 TaxID=2937788 RepID=UPI00216441BF|nr:hypothetical protein [Sphingomonas sp. SUN019]UVO49557.1 hypothetical protein M0208_03155 [Sphingomonas sp. SUN019]